MQHHRAHIASVLAEREAWEEPVHRCEPRRNWLRRRQGHLGRGNIRRQHCRRIRTRRALRYALLLEATQPRDIPCRPRPAFWHRWTTCRTCSAAPFLFPGRYEASRLLASNGLRTFPTTSMGRLFDAAAALLGFTRPITFEGQAAMWLEHVARRADPRRLYPFPLIGRRTGFPSVACER